MNLTSRMESWITALGVHIATVDPKGFPVITVADTAEVSGDTVTVRLSEKQAAQIAESLAHSPNAALAPGKIGSIRAPYQFKGPAKLEGGTLTVSVTEIYCTKPGAEAGIRLDTLGFESMRHFDESRWTDTAPSGK